MAVRRVGLARGITRGIAGGLSSGVTAAPAFSPADLAGLALWLKPESLSGYANGAGISSWADSSGLSGRNADQATSGNQPLCVASALNGYSAASFDGSNDYLRTATTGAIAQPLTYFIVYNQLTSTQANLISPASGGGVDFYASSPNFQNTLRAEAGSAINVGSALGWNVGAAVFNGASSKVWRNGATPVTGNTGSGGTNGWTIGQRTDLASPWKDKIIEIIVYTAALSDANVGLVRAYLNTKFGSIY